MNVLRAWGVPTLLVLALFSSCTGRSTDGVLETGLVRHASGATFPRVAGFLTSRESGVQLWYERFGELGRPAVVLVNGSDSQAIFWPLEFVMTLLDRGYQVVRYDPRDVGLSEWLPFPNGFDPQAWTPDVPPPYGLGAHVEDLLGLLDGLGIDRVHLVGISQGGMVAQLTAISAPERVRSLALLATTPSNPYDPDFGGVDPELLAYLREQAPRVGRAAATSWFGNERVVALQTDLFARMAGVGSADRPAIRRYVQATADRAGINARSSQGFAVAGAPSRVPVLQQISAPTLVVHGKSDLFFAKAHALALAAGIRDAQLVWVEAGHGFPTEAFTDRVDDLVQNFERTLD